MTTIINIIITAVGVTTGRRYRDFAIDGYASSDRNTQPLTSGIISALQHIECCRTADDIPGRGGETEPLDYAATIEISGPKAVEIATLHQLPPARAEQILKVHEAMWNSDDAADKPAMIRKHLHKLIDTAQFKPRGFATIG